MGVRAGNTAVPGDFFTRHLVIWAAMAAMLGTCGCGSSAKDTVQGGGGGEAGEPVSESGTSGEEDGGAPAGGAEAESGGAGIHAVQGGGGGQAGDMVNESGTSGEEDGGAPAGGAEAESGGAGASGASGTAGSAGDSGPLPHCDEWTSFYRWESALVGANRACKVDTDCEGYTDPFELRNAPCIWGPAVAVRRGEVLSAATAEVVAIYQACDDDPPPQPTCGDPPPPGPFAFNPKPVCGPGRYCDRTTTPAYQRYCGSSHPPSCEEIDSGYYFNAFADTPGCRAVDSWYCGDPVSGPLDGNEDLYFHTRQDCEADCSATCCPIGYYWQSAYFSSLEECETSCTPRDQYAAPSRVFMLQAVVEQTIFEPATTTEPAPVEVRIGDVITGSYAFEPAWPGTRVASSHAVYETTADNSWMTSSSEDARVIGAKLEVGGLGLFNGEPGLFAESGFVNEFTARSAIDVMDDHTDEDVGVPRDAYRVHQTFIKAAPPYWDWTGTLSIELLTTEELSSITSTDLPLVPPDIDHFQTRSIELSLENSAGSQLVIRGKLTSLELEP